MKYEKEIESYLADSGGIITYSACKNANIPTVYLSRMAKKGDLTRVGSGIYASKNGDYDEFYFFQYQFKKALFSYDTALYLLGVTDTIAQIMDVSVPSNYKFNNFIPNITIHYIKNQWYTLGLTKTKTMFGNTVKVYSYERVLCDFIIHRKDIDSETYIKAIRGYKNYTERDVNNLYLIAEKMNISSKVQEIMELTYE